MTKVIMEFYFYVQDIFISAIYWYTLFILGVAVLYLMCGISYNYKDVIKERILNFYKRINDK